MYCKSDDLLRVWYKNLNERVKLNVLEKYQAVWEKYTRVIKVLIKFPKDPYAWLRNWSMAVKKAAVYGIVMANKPWCHGASCMQANDAEGRKNDRLKKEREGKRRKGLTRANTAIYNKKRGAPA